MAGYKIYNAPMPTTALLADVATGATTKSMLQLATPSDMQIQITSWGYSLSTVPGGATSRIELVETDVAATVTAHVASGIVKDDPNAPASRLTLGVAATGYTASAEGAIAATRVFDTEIVPVTAGASDLRYAYQFMPDERPIVAVSKFLRVRVTMATSGAQMLCWVKYIQL